MVRCHIARVCARARLALFLQQLGEALQGPVGGGLLVGLRPRFRGGFGVFHARVLVLVAVDAQQLPVAAVGRVVVVVAVLVVHGELAQALAVELARAARADPRQDLQCLAAVVIAHAGSMRASPEKKEAVRRRPLRGEPKSQGGEGLWLRGTSLSVTPMPLSVARAGNLL